ncbi:MAG: hypothetical protein ACE37M_03390 [Henriciella sp.]
MKHILTALALFAMPLASNVAHAQLDGRLGESSTAALDFSLNVTEGNRLQIYGFTNMVQTIEAGEQLPAFIYQGETGGLPCIAADLPDTKVALDWALTPLADTADATNVVPFIFELYKNAAFEIDDGVRIVRVEESDSRQPQSGTVLDVETWSGAHGSACTQNNSSGVLEFYYRRGNSDSGRRPSKAGTYVSTITITVRPQ